MKCPFCAYFESKGNRFRPTDEGQAIRRKKRMYKNVVEGFTTYEKNRKRYLL